MTTQKGSGLRVDSLEDGVVIDTLETSDARLVIIPRQKDQGPKVWAIHRLRIHSVGVAEAMPFDATFTNGVPPGEIDVADSFGPSGVSRQIGRRASVRVDGTYRNYRNFYATVTDTATGRVTDAFGKAFDLSLVDNTNGVQRKYTGMTSSVTYRLGTALNAGGSYTLSHAWGNVYGEASNGSGPSDIGVHPPEYKDATWNNPAGDLAVDQCHRANLWATYALPFLQGLSISGLQNVASGVPYGAVGTVNATPFVTNPGYVTPGGSGVAYYFTARDAYRTAATYRTDVAANYSFTLKGVGRKTDLFVQAQVLNVFNQFQLCGCGDTVFKNGGGVDLTTIDQSVLTRSNSATVAAFNPFNATPVQGTNWSLGPNFGKALSRMAYTAPRTVRMSFGVRF